MLQSLPEREVTKSVQPSGRETLDGKDYKYLINKVDKFESHLGELSIKVGQLKLEKLTQNREASQASRSDKSASKKRGEGVDSKDLKILEKKINKKVTEKLTVVVDKLGKLIKKQELRMLKLQKAVKGDKGAERKIAEAKPEMQIENQEELGPRRGRKSA